LSYRTFSKPAGADLLSSMACDASLTVIGNVRPRFRRLVRVKNAPSGCRTTQHLNVTSLRFGRQPIETDRIHVGRITTGSRWGTVAPDIFLSPKMSEFCILPYRPLIPS